MIKRTDKSKAPFRAIVSKTLTEEWIDAPFRALLECGHTVNCHGFYGAHCIKCMKERKMSDDVPGTELFQSAVMEAILKAMPESCDILTAIEEGTRKAMERHLAIKNYAEKVG